MSDFSICFLLFACQLSIMESISKNRHIALSLLNCLLFSFLLSIGFTLHIKFSHSFSTLKFQFIKNLLTTEFLFLLFCFSQFTNNSNTAFGVRKFKRLGNHFILMLQKKFFNIIIYINIQNFAIINKHTIFFEETAWLLVCSSLKDIINIINGIATNKRTIILIEFFNCIILCHSLNDRAFSITQILNIIIN